MDSMGYTLVASPEISDSADKNILDSTKTQHFIHISCCILVRAHY